MFEQSCLTSLGAIREDQVAAYERFILERGNELIFQDWPTLEQFVDYCEAVQLNTEDFFSRLISQWPPSC
jgi:hypothetical protein